MKTVYKIFPIFIIFFIFSGCKTAPPVDFSTLNKAEFFQKAQTASNKGNYPLALDYYNNFLLKFPTDIQGDIEAKYEIALIAYKQNNYKKAEKLFSGILDQYSTDAAQVLPAWPKILSQKILKEIKK